MLHLLEHMFENVQAHPGITHRRNKPEQKNGKTHDKLISCPQLLLLPALPLSNGRGDENHDKGTIEQTLEGEANEDRGSKSTGHACWFQSCQGARDLRKEGNRIDAAGLSPLDDLFGAGLLQVISIQGRRCTRFGDTLLRPRLTSPTASRLRASRNPMLSHRHKEGNIASAPCPERFCDIANVERYPRVGLDSRQRISHTSAVHQSRAVPPKCRKGRRFNSSDATFTSVTRDLKRPGIQLLVTGDETKRQKSW